MLFPILFLKGKNCQTSSFFWNSPLLGMIKQWNCNVLNFSQIQYEFESTFPIRIYNFLSYFFPPFLSISFMYSYRFSVVIISTLTYWPIKTSSPAPNTTLQKTLLVNNTSSNSNAITHFWTILTEMKSFYQIKIKDINQINL